MSTLAQAHPLAAVERAEAPPLAAAAIERWLGAASAGERAVVEVVAATGSTNEDLLIRCRESQPSSPILRAADYQARGRGRRQRVWVGRPRASLLFSLAVPLDTLAGGLPAITLAAGVALAECLRGGGIAVTLKWPNDLLYEGRKLGGVLCELAVDAAGRGTLVVGVGINGWLTDDERASIGPPVAALTEAVAPSLFAAEREAWIGQLASSLLAEVRLYRSDGFAPLRGRYNALLQWRGESVTIIDSGRTLASGRLVEVDADGRLLLETASGSRAVNVGDVSLRQAESTP